MTEPTYDRAYWDGRSGWEPIRAVLDHRDRLGKKNRYIDIVQKMALSEWYEAEGRVLDLGCGTGRFTEWISHRSRQVIGTEISEGMLRSARHRLPGGEFVLYDGQSLPFADETFQAVVAVGVLQDIPGDDAYVSLLREAGRCIERGGRLYLLDQVSDAEGRPWRTAGQVTEACAVAGLVLERCRPVRKGRWWLLYLIRYGLVPAALLEKVARWELRLREREPSRISYYMDYLFELKKG
ncbi:MAG: class I SAM-dependent methyltransferase [Planctomycetota bacterium]|nr:class I SAM-dependent methyltransferase [Planctomycetota bacterium]